MNVIDIVSLCRLIRICYRLPPDELPEDLDELLEDLEEEDDDDDLDGDDDDEREGLEEDL